MSSYNIKPESGDDLLEKPVKKMKKKDYHIKDIQP